MHLVQTLLPLYDPAYMTPPGSASTAAHSIASRTKSERSLAEQTFARDELVVGRKKSNGFD